MGGAYGSVDCLYGFHYLARLIEHSGTVTELGLNS